MVQKALASPRFWQIWALLGGIGTAVAGARLAYPLKATPEHIETQANAALKSRTQLPPMLESEPVAAAPAKRPFARLAVAATANERCALLDQVEPSEDTEGTYAITAVLERAHLSSVRACAT